MTDPPTERALLEAARGGDGAAFGRLVEPYRAELHAHCYRMLGSVQDAEDALQDALLGAWRRLASFEGRGPLRAWLEPYPTPRAATSCARASSWPSWPRSSTCRRPSGRS